ncbi:class I SAM-dependent methyltransferase [Enhygromyxa salina]|uniref:Putative methyltransferase YcgJ n=1 Tax=Enhygromyxa salina TaxID=215803 RepID=A0A2S9YSL8_9BACT|nr:class I SAM-dependent methyltransferase [Enhygromyxa salina]PRQ08042.1 putative methyltransferase YcgJ [Enhygromyxa salina]
MNRLLAAFFVATLGGACGSISTPAGISTADSGAHQEARPHENENENGNEHMHAFVSADEWTKVLDDPARDEWQRPADVLHALELTPTMIVADVGAGTGYFAVRLARAVPAGEVIATDVAPDMVRFLNERARHEQLPNLRAVRATHTELGLAPRSVDRILIVHVWHHLADRVDYARSLAAALRPGGRLFIVDFNLEGRRGPPANMRVAPEVLVAELEEAGLAARVSLVALPDQYIVEASLEPLEQQEPGST